MSVFSTIQQNFALNKTQVKCFLQQNAASIYDFSLFSSQGDKIWSVDHLQTLTYSNDDKSRRIAHFTL